MGNKRFLVRENQNYLFRVIGASMAQELEIRIGSHKMIIIATDGNPVKPVEVDSLIVGGGERFDFYIRTKGADNQDNFFITVRSLETFTFQEGTYALGPINYENYGLAVLRYERASKRSAICGNACHNCGKNGDPTCTKVYMLLN